MGSSATSCTTGHGAWCGVGTPTGREADPSSCKGVFVSVGIACGAFTAGANNPGFFVAGAGTCVALAEPVRDVEATAFAFAEDLEP